MFPREAVYGLTSQIRRAAVSVASNVAEGQGRATVGEFLVFLGQARGSLFEVHTQILIAHELDYLNDEQAMQLIELVSGVAKPLNGLISALQKGQRKRRSQG